MNERSNWSATTYATLMALVALLFLGGTLYWTGAVRDRSHEASISYQEFDQYVLAAARAEHEHCTFLGYEVPVWMTDTTSAAYRHRSTDPGNMYPRTFACARRMGEELIFSAPPPCNLGLIQQRYGAPSRQWLREACHLDIPKHRAPVE